MPRGSSENRTPWDLQSGSDLTAKDDDRNGGGDFFVFKIVDAVDLLVAPADDNVVGEDSAFFGLGIFLYGPNDRAAVTCRAVDGHFAVVFDILDGNIAKGFLDACFALLSLADDGQNRCVGNYKGEQSG